MTIESLGVQAEMNDLVRSMNGVSYQRQTMLFGGSPDVSDKRQSTMSGVSVF
jgi:hypothetical protein